MQSSDDKQSAEKTADENAVYIGASLELTGSSGVNESSEIGQSGDSNGKSTEAETTDATEGKKESVEGNIKGLLTECEVCM